MSQVVEQERPKVPPLESGDHLTQPEFHARYLATRRLKKAELIEGIVFMPSPVSHLHSWAHSKIVAWLEQYAVNKGRVEVCSGATLVLDDQNEFQPDALLRRTEGASPAPRSEEACDSSPPLPGSWVDGDGYLRGAPELVVEIAVTSAAIDLREKREVYRRAGVAEYLVWQVMDEQVAWWVLEDGAYRAIEPSEEGLLTSRVFTGLRLDSFALLKGEMGRVLDKLRPES